MLTEDDADGRTAEELEQIIRRKESKSRAIVLEMTGDLPDAEVKPPDEVLFVCKLNPAATDEDLELIFSVGESAGTKTADGLRTRIFN